MKKLVCALLMASALCPLGAIAARQQFDSHCSWRHKKDIQNSVLKGNVAETEDPSVVSWMDKPSDEINKSFVQYSSTGGHALCDEISPQFRELLNSEHFNGWQHAANSTPGQDVMYPSWSAWQGGIHEAMYQLRWELWTDPKQGVCRLGHTQAWPNGSPLWVSSPSSTRHGVLIQGSTREPGLSTHAYFKGNARVLVQFYPNRRLQTRVLSSTLSDAETERLVQSIEALNGHPVVTYPRTDLKVSSVAMVYSFGFDDTDSVR